MFKTLMCLTSLASLTYFFLSFFREAFTEANLKHWGIFHFVASFRWTAWFIFFSFSLGTLLGWSFSYFICLFLILFIHLPNYFVNYFHFQWITPIPIAPYLFFPSFCHKNFDPCLFLHPLHRIFSETNTLLFWPEIAAFQTFSSTANVFCL